MIIRAEHSERQRELTPEALRRELTPEALRLRRVNKVFGMQSERSKFDIVGRGSINGFWCPDLVGAIVPSQTCLLKGDFEVKLFISIRCIANKCLLHSQATGTQRVGNFNRLFPGCATCNSTCLSVSGNIWRIPCCAVISLGNLIGCSCREADNSERLIGFQLDAGNGRSRICTCCFRSGSVSCILLNNAGELRGSRIFGPVARELRAVNMKVVSLAPEVL